MSTTRLTAALGATGVAMTLLGGCAAPETRPAPALAAAPTPVPVMDTLVSPLETRRSGCAVRRTLDGRVVCGRPLASAATETRPTAAGTAPPPARVGAGAGEYVVIGSFRDADNARRWAAFNDEFGTAVQQVEQRDGTYYRVVVGPMNGENASVFREILDAVGVAGSWALSLCAAGAPAADGQCPALENARLADVGEQ